MYTSLQAKFLEAKNNFSGALELINQVWQMIIIIINL